ncbi:tRNA dihydrouridine synthase DusB [Halanaerobacter jeridensis]|uniref:tRNA-dihydrouridine synthase n=1 Tax=Halanaerobacter jeridensis TaxID=706427 RepID=A0A938XWY1_9FIRM|nr:tRNA dihydrouridine synthase DusB [Halanaerobacter jeridensis]MBM7557162.1 tRNA-dihydrouridine synthase B [Halanaerobacter jeridensis]
MLKIGDVKVEPPVALAPMAGVTDLPYRRLVKEQGCGLVYTEMVSAKGLIHGNDKTKQLLTIADDERPVALQLFGDAPEDLAEAAKIVENEAQPEIIDLNVGCPAPKIVSSGYGSALMKRPELLGEIVAAMDQAVDTHVTVKIRAGWDEDQRNAVEVAKIAEENGAQALAVHGRTREEFYQGQADWEIIKKVKAALKIPVFGNGDVFGPEDAEKMLELTNCDGIMIARGAKGNPWIFKRVAHYLNSGEIISPPQPEQKITTAINHLKKLVEYKGEYVGVREMRKHAAWYLKGLRNCTVVKEKVNHAESLEEMTAILQGYREQFK